MAVQTFYKPALLVMGGVRASDHSRSPLQVNSKRIESTQRMANGSLRKYFVATKREFSVSWDLLPHTSRYTVDGFMGAKELANFYETNYGGFQFAVVSGQLAVAGEEAYIHQGRRYKADVYQVHFTDFSSEVVKRGRDYDMYNVSMSLEEI